MCRLYLAVRLSRGVVADNGKELATFTGPMIAHYAIVRDALSNYEAIGLLQPTP
jgi:hypothetical protein